MRVSHRVHVAWHMLLHRKGRFLLSMLGIAFSVVIMFMEIGFFNGINDSQARLPTFLDADLVLLGKDRYSLLETDTVSRIRMQQALGVEGVVRATPLYEGFTLVANPQTGLVQAISVLAFPPHTAPLVTAGLKEAADSLGVKGNILFDRLSRNIYGDIKVGTALTVGGANDRVVGLVELGPSIKSDGFILMGDETWADSDSSADSISLGLLKLKPEADLEAVRQKLISLLGDEVGVLTPEEIRRREITYTIKATPVGGIFAVGLVIGFLIGSIICYQILFNEISDNMPQYATVKAVGFSRYYLIALVMQQAVLLAIFGFIPGLIGGYSLYTFLQRSTGILMAMSVARVSFIFFLTLCMCVGSGMLAVKKVLRADPAEVF